MVAGYFFCCCFYCCSIAYTSWGQYDSENSRNIHAGMGKSAWRYITYVAIYVIVYSVILFYAEQIKLIQPETIQKSVTYSYIQPWGPKVINGFASVIPVFKDMFADLQSFFEGGAKSRSIELTCV